MDGWHVYILECSDKTLYTGIAKDVTQRVAAHNSSALGAKYTRGRRPVSLLYSDLLQDKSSALKEELRIKNLSRKEKLALIHCSHA